MHAFTATVGIPLRPYLRWLRVKRRELAALAPGQVRDLLGLEPGSVSPVSPRPEAVVFVDEDVLTILPTLYCGIGRCDRTLEIAPADLVRLTGARVASLSRAAMGSSA